MRSNLTCACFVYTVTDVDGDPHRNRPPKKLSFPKELCSKSASCWRTLPKSGLSGTNSLVYGAVDRRSAHELSDDSVVDEWCVTAQRHHLPLKKEIKVSFFVSPQVSFRVALQVLFYCPEADNIRTRKESRCLFSFPPCSLFLCRITRSLLLAQRHQLPLKKGIKMHAAAGMLRQSLNFVLQLILSTHFQG